MKDAKTRLRRLDFWAWIFTAIVLIVVVALRYAHIETDADLSGLPKIYSSLNALCAVLLVLGRIAIKRKNVKWHRTYMVMALITSVLFLVSYIAYHLTNEPVRYGGTGFWKFVYLFLLATHVILAALVLPFVLFTVNRAIVGMYDAHTAMARYVYPLWLYVAITGPLCYLMLEPYYP